ncbi:MAG: hypothetical protein RLZZ385_823 [Pseudomonadota bacterium]|jgi:DNA-binding response OmpR family regulator
MIEQKRIVVIDDDEVFSRILQLGLKKNGYECYLISNVNDAMNYLAHARNTDLFIVDYELDDKTENGLSLCRKIRVNSKKPIIMLTGDTTTETTVSCLYAGANEYVTKPYVLAELLARIHVILRMEDERQASAARTDKRKLEGLELNSRLRTLSSHLCTVNLTERELAVAEVLIANEGQEIKRDHIYSAVYGRQMRPFSRAVDILVGRFRKKLVIVTDAYLILPTRNAGYRFVRREHSLLAAGNAR